jgi:hypothetical protein
MLNIKKGVITLTRGDSAVLKLDLKTTDGESYAMQSGDSLLLTLKTSPDVAEILMQKKINNMEFIINPEDTSSLAFGIYYYDIQLTTADGYIYTVCQCNKWIVAEEVG